VPAQITSPQVVGGPAGGFSFNFQTASNQSYTVQQNTNLATTNWTFYTNITGNGSLYQFATPVTNILQHSFRVRQA
jgi:hypothetical protein